MDTDPLQDSIDELFLIAERLRAGWCPDCAPSFGPAARYTVTPDGFMERTASKKIGPLGPRNILIHRDPRLSASRESEWRPFEKAPGTDNDVFTGSEADTPLARFSNAKLAYIAGPYAAPDSKTREENVRRIGELCLYALKNGFAPITVHAAIEAGHYGRDEDEEDRKRALAADCEIVAAVAKQGGALFVILRDDGSRSTGSDLEWQAFVRNSPVGLCRCFEKTWTQWADILAGLVPFERQE